MKVKVLGSGTSTGVPLIGCDCKVCISQNPKNKRLRPSILIEEKGVNCLIDTTPDLRTQALNFNVKKIDCVFYTHTHADHLHGIDDLRIFNYIQKGSIPVFASENDIKTITTKFDYIFKKEKLLSSKPDLIPNIIDKKLEFKGLTFLSIPIYHGYDLINGYRLKTLAYLTDISKIPESSLELLEGLDALMIDALRYQKHPTHLSVEEAINISGILKPSKTYLIHMSHKIDYEEIKKALPPNIIPSYDGLEFEI